MGSEMCIRDRSVSEPNPELAATKSQEPTMAKDPEAETMKAEIDEEELIGFDDQEFAATDEPAKRDSEEMKAKLGELATGGLDFEEANEPTLADTGNHSLQESGDAKMDKSGDWADVAVADVVEPTQDTGFPGVLETNARIAGHNLALMGIQARSKTSFSQTPNEATELAKRLETLAEANHQIQDIISSAPAAERENLIKLAPFREFANRFLMQFRGLSAEDLGTNANDRVEMINTLEKFTQ